MITPFQQIHKHIVPIYAIAYVQTVVHNTHTRIIYPANSNVKSILTNVLSAHAWPYHHLLQSDIYNINGIDLFVVISKTSI